MTAASSKRLTLIHQFEQQYQSSLHKTDLIYRDEENRLLQLHTLALQDENKALEVRQSQGDKRIELLAQQADQARLELHSHREIIDLKDGQLDRQALEMAKLKAEVHCLNATIKNSTETMQEKFALTRELDRLRPEMEHLQSQIADYQEVVAQKYDLQRQINALEINLENERLLNEQSRHRQENSLISELRGKLVEAEKQASMSKVEQDKVKAEHERELAEAQSLAERLKERATTLKTKLKDVQGELKDAYAQLETCRADLQCAQALRQAEDRRMAKSAKNPLKAAKDLGPRKSRIKIAIETPVKDEFIMKPIRKRTAEQALVGEKSTFSITPFLNRSKNLLNDSNEEASPAQDPNLALDEQGQCPTPLIADLEASEEPPITAKPQKPRGRPKANPSSNDQPSEKRKPPLSAKISIAPKACGPNGGTECPALQEHENTIESLGSHTKMKKVGIANIFVPNGKKKRKLQGGTGSNMIEEEDGETMQQPVKGPMGPPPKRLKGPLKSALNAFATTGAFSPLKRDRRGVNASFLA